jgi:hypothetical protein
MDDTGLFELLSLFLMTLNAPFSGQLPGHLFLARDSADNDDGCQ